MKREHIDYLDRITKELTGNASSALARYNMKAHLAHEFGMQYHEASEVVDQYISYRKAKGDFEV